VGSEAGDSVEVAAPVDLALPCSPPLQTGLNIGTQIRKVTHFSLSYAEQTMDGIVKS